MILMMSASQFYTQRQLMTKNVDMTVKTPFMQQQKMLMYVFPVMFAVFGINFPVGVLIYWLTTNVWTMGQQMVVIRHNPTPGEALPFETSARSGCASQGQAAPSRSRSAKGPHHRGRRGRVRRQAAQAADASAPAAARCRRRRRRRSAAEAPTTAEAQASTDAAPDAAQPDAGPSREDGKPGGRLRRLAEAGSSRGGQQPKAGPQRKGPQRSKHPSKK